MYSARERRAGAGRILACLITVALVVLALGLGTDFEFNTTGLLPTAVVTSTVAIGVLRTAYESAALEAMKLLGVRRRLVVAGDRESTGRIVGQLAAGRGGLAFDVVGIVSPDGTNGPPVIAQTIDELPAVLDRLRPHELILAEGVYAERAMLGVVEQAHRAGVRVRLVPTTTDLLVHEVDYVPGQGAPLFELRPPSSPGRLGC